MGNSRDILRVAAWGLFGTWFAAITLISSLPGHTLGETPFNAADKAVHALAFFCGAVFLTLALLRRKEMPLTSVAASAWVILAVIGVADEIHQLQTPGRSGADPGDWLADVLGATLGILFILWLHGRRSAPPNPSTPGRTRPA